MAPKINEAVEKKVRNENGLCLSLCLLPLSAFLSEIHDEIFVIVKSREGAISNEEVKQ
jgi:hypothetical protein